MCVVISFCVLGTIIDRTLSLITVCLMIEITLSLWASVQSPTCVALDQAPPKACGWAKLEQN